MVFVLLSSLLLFLTFPKIDLWPLAWIGLIPLLRVLDGKNSKKAFNYGYLCGFVFFLGAFFWLRHVTILGTVLLALYSAVYFGLFAAGYSYFQDRRLLTRISLIPSVWVVLEFTRGHLFSGFGWASLGESQYKFLPIIQVADVTGMYGVSFLIVMVNVLLEEIIFKKNARKEIFGAIACVDILLVLALGYGFFRLSEIPQETSHMSIALIQANVPQEIKWVESYWPTVIKDHETITQLAAEELPDLIIWPETSFPGFMGEPAHAELLKGVQDFVKTVHIPLLVGSVVKDGPEYFNSAVLLSHHGEILERYDKIHLVPFGEFIPFRSTFPFLEFVAPIADFSVGNKYTVFSLGEPSSDPRGPKRFSVIICFEDTIAHLTRQFVKNGAQLLINITNDAWFKDSSEPFMHLQSCVFRAVENRRDMVRAANTGISCFIDRFGHVKKYVEDKNGKKTFVINYAVDTMGFYNDQTFYTKFGDVFTYVCFGCILGAIYIKRRHP